VKTEIKSLDESLKSMRIKTTESLLKGEFWMKLMN